MSRRLITGLVALALLAAACVPSPTPATTIPSGKNQKYLGPSSPNTNIPVACSKANGNVYVPTGSMPAQDTVSIRCIGSSEKKELDTLVKKLTSSTNVVLGAIELLPSYPPFKFNKDVTVTIPLDPQRYDLRNTKADLYVYSPDSGDFFKISQAQIDSQGMAANAKINHFSIFILVGSAEGETEPPPQTEPPVTGFTCDDPLGCIDIAPGDSIRIASLLDFTGQGELSTAIQDGINAAVKDFGSIAGHEVEVITLDGGCSEEMGVDAAYRVINDPKMVGVIGTLCSASAKGARSIISDAGYVMISPANTRTSFTYSESLPGFFRVSTPDIYQAQYMAEFAYRELGARRIGIFRADNEYSRELADAFAEWFNASGGEITLYQVVPFGMGDIANEMSALMSRLEESQTDAIYMPLFMPEAATFVSWVSEWGGEFSLLGADTINPPDFVNSISTIQRVFYTETSPTLSNNPYAYGYDAARLLLDSISRIAILDENGALYIGRQALRDALHGVSFGGQTGMVACNPNGDCGHAAIAIYRIEDNQSSLTTSYTP